MLLVQHLAITFTRYETGLQQKQLCPIRDLNLSVQAGELVAIVGASGSGKSLLAHAILGILPDNAQLQGELQFKGESLTPPRQAQLRGKEIALIPQSISYLNPLMTVGAQVRRAAQLSGLTANNAQQVVDQIFDRYCLDLAVQQLYPFQVSGGMARRVLIATAAIGQADLVIADEPTSGLNPELVSETMLHLRELVNTGRSVILITHDLEAALSVADRIAVFYAGQTLELAQPDDFRQGNLQHPYSRALWRSLPQNDFMPTIDYAFQQ